MINSLLYFKKKINIFKLTSISTKLINFILCTQVLILTVIRNNSTNLYLYESLKILSGYTIFPNYDKSHLYTMISQPTFSLPIFSSF